MGASSTGEGRTRLSVRPLHPGAIVRFLRALLLLSTAAAAQEISLLPIATGLEMPVAITNARDGRLFITQQRGIVSIYDGTALLPTPFLDIQSKVLCCGERGLLSIAFHPNYRQNGFFFVYYIDLNADIVVARYKVSDDPNRADPDSETILLTINHRTYANHNGGQLVFGPDGFLYAGTGDGGSGGDPFGNGQNTNALLGKILRLDVDHGSPYGIPASNPFVGQSGKREEIWAYGMRNPWRFSFDRATGDLLIADVGQGSWEEIDFQPAASSGGTNYGWNIMEGTHCYNASTCNQNGLTLPILEYGHVNGACSVTGGYRYRGERYPRFQGTYIYGDYCNGMIWGATQGNPWTSSLLADASFNISSFGEDAAGELYVTDYAGRILRIHDAHVPMFPTTVTATAASATSVNVTWSAVSGASSYEVFRSADGTNYASVGSTSAASLTDSGLQSNTAYLYKVRAMSASATGPLSNADLATTVIFSTDTIVRAVHIEQLRTAVNAVRRLAGLGDASFTDATLTLIRAVHISELRARLAEARYALMLPALSYTDPTIVARSTVVKAAHVNELRNGTR
jgi:glucose/arabinose dehydrogenase